MAYSIRVFGPVDCGFVWGTLPSMRLNYLCVLLLLLVEAAAASQIRLIESLVPRIQDRAAGLYALAEVYAEAGDLPKALSFLKECVSLGEGFDPSPFEKLRTTPGFQQLVDRVHREFPPVSRASIAFTLPQRDLIPEGLAADPGKQMLYLGSLHRKKIVAITAEGAISDFVPEGKYDLLPLCGLKVDPQDHSLWVSGCDTSGGRGELMHFDAAGALVGRHSVPGAGRHLFNDLVLRGSREIYLTDSLANEVYRFDRATHSFKPLSMPRPMYYPNGIALSGDERLLYIADAFGVFAFDLATGASREMKPGRSNTLAGVDGLYWSRGMLIAVQNGLGSPRIARFQLSPDGLDVQNAAILERRSPLLEIPTTGALMGSRFYFIANSQLQNLRDAKIADPKRLEPVRIGVLELN